MSRIIIENRTDASDSTVIGLVSQIIDDGRVSNEGKQYCYATRFIFADNSEYLVTTHLNKSSDRFLVTEVEG